ncbi:MAG: hypothetical protein IPH32_10445 [Bacteroidetes bacterium]|nr:hypothetical protein [Bacteroidota bacterium]
MFRNDSILEPFKQCITRRRFLADNYKKAIVDLRKKIYPMEYKYSKEIDYLLYNPSTECLKLFNLITKEIKIKQMLLNDVLKVKLELVKTKELSLTELNSFKELSITECETDFCWLAINYPKEAIVAKGLYRLKDKQQYGLNVINAENEVERVRQSIISKALKLGYKGSNQGLANDNRKLKKKHKEVSSYRKEIADPKSFNEKRYSKIVFRLKKLLERK